MILMPSRSASRSRSASTARPSTHQLMWILGRKDEPSQIPSPIQGRTEGRARQEKDPTQ
jgi:hypothetical protein